MNTIELKGTVRLETGKRLTKNARKEDMIPCVLYSKGKCKHFCIPLADVNKAIHTRETFLVKLELEGTVHQSIIQAVQFHSVFDNTLHVDFLEVSEDKPIEVELPIALIGIPEGVAAGGKLNQKLRRMRVKGIYSKLPATVDVDVSGLRLGRSLIISNLEYKDFSVKMAKDVAIASVEIPRALKQEAEKAEKLVEKKTEEVKKEPEKAEKKTTDKPNKK